MLKNNTFYKIITLLTFSLVLSCKPSAKNEKYTIVTTTSMITDLVQTLGGDAIEVQGMMGAGIDPHLYKASAGDVNKLVNADLIIYNGLHLEGKLAEVFEKMEHQGKKTIALGEYLPKEDVIHSENFQSNYDPHIWFSIDNWRKITEALVEELMILDPKNKDIYAANGADFVKKLQELKIKINHKIEELPVDKRILVTAHDAFSYFGKDFKFQVLGLQGLSTATEAGVQDVQKLADFIIQKQIKAVFIESSVPKRTVEALQAAVKAAGHEVNIGGELFSDALGDKNTNEGTYIGMFTYNVNTIVNALK